MISVCMASYNGGKYIREQIESILPQLSREDELIISDDASSDSTCEIIESFHDSRIKLLHHTPCGLIKNFENALSHAAGDYIFLSDQDDIWLPGKLGTCMGMFEKGFDLVLSDAKIVDDKLSIISSSFMCQNYSGKGIIHNIIKNSYIGCCMAFRKSLLSIILPFPNEIHMHDEWIGLLCEVKFKKISFIRTPFVLYRRHDHNVSESGGKSSNTFSQKLRIRFYNIKALLNRLIFA